MCLVPKFKQHLGPRLDDPLCGVWGFLMKGKVLKWLRKGVILPGTSKKNKAGLFGTFCKRTIGPVEKMNQLVGVGVWRHLGVE